MYVLSNEKVVSIDVSCYKLFTLRFSKESVEALPCEMSISNQRTLFLLFDYNNCIQLNCTPAITANHSNNVIIFSR